MAGFYGKLPVKGDFVYRNLEREVIAHFESWFQMGIVKSHEVLKESINERYFTAPVWHFYIAPGVVDDKAWLGVWVASKDSAKRMFPVVVLAPCEEIFIVPSDIDLYFDWFTEAQNLILDLFDNVIDFDTFCEEVELLDVYQFIPESDDGDIEEVEEHTKVRRTSVSSANGLGEEQFIALQNQISRLKQQNEHILADNKQLKENVKSLNDKLDYLMRHFMGEKVMSGIQPLQPPIIQREIIQSEIIQQEIVQPEIKKPIENRVKSKSPQTIINDDESHKRQSESPIDTSTENLFGAFNENDTSQVADSNQNEVDKLKTRHSLPERVATNPETSESVSSKPSSTIDAKIERQSEQFTKVIPRKSLPIEDESGDTESEQFTQMTPRKSLPITDEADDIESEQFTKVIPRESSTQLESEATSLPLTLEFSKNIVEQEQMQLEVTLDSSVHPVCIWVSGGSDTVEEQFVLTQRLPDDNDFVKFLVGFD